jgi:hypothetical protein
MIYVLVRCLLGCVVVTARGEASKDAELLVLRHENAVLRRQASRVRYQPGGRLWLVALSRVIARQRWGAAPGRRRCLPGTGDWPRARGATPAGGAPGGRRRQPRSASS